MHISVCASKYVAYEVADAWDADCLALLGKVNELGAENCLPFFGLSARIFKSLLETHYNGPNRIFTDGCCDRLLLGWHALIGLEDGYAVI